MVKLDQIEQNLDKKDKLMQEIRLKKDQICEVFICYLRSVLKEAFLKYVDDPNINIKLTEVSNLEFETHCLEKYLQTVKLQSIKLEE